MSASLLADMIARVSAPVVVSENHDVNTITVEESAVTNAMAFVTGGAAWDAAEYGISRETAAAMIAAANTPEARERVLADLRQRAIRRAGLDTTGGTVAVMVAGKAPWHGLGVNVADAVTSDQAIRLAGLNWRVEATDLFYTAPDGTSRKANGVRGIVRQDSGAMLGSVGSRYKPIQNAEAFGFMDALLSDFGARYETAGSIFGGEKVWMMVRLPAQAFAVNGSDRVEPYAIFTNPHDGSGAAYCFPTTERVVCANTFRVASQGRGNKGISIRHTGDVKARVKSAQCAMGLAVKGFESFAETAQAMAATRIDPKEYASNVLDRVLAVTAAQAAAGFDLMEGVLMMTEAEQAAKRAEFDNECEKRENILEDILTRYESEKNGVNGMRGSVWAAFNSVTESADHGAAGGRYTGEQVARASRRFDSVLNGRADEVKQVAYTLATAASRA